MALGDFGTERGVLVPLGGKVAARLVGFFLGIVDYGIGKGRTDAA
jgi:hypothetical protein